MRELRGGLRCLDKRVAGGGEEQSLKPTHTPSNAKSAPSHWNHGTDTVIGEALRAKTRPEMGGVLNTRSWVGFGVSDLTTARVCNCNSTTSCACGGRDAMSSGRQEKQKRYRLEFQMALQLQESRWMLTLAPPNRPPDLG